MSLRKLRAEWIVAGASNIKDPTARRAYLDSACGGNEPLRQEVEALLGNRQPASGAPSGPPPVPRLSEAACGTARPDDSRWTRRHPVLVGLAVVLLALVVGVGVSKVELGLRSARPAPPAGGEGLPQEPVDAMAAEAGITNLPINLAAWTNATHDKGWVPPLTPERVEGHGLLGLDPGRHVLREIEFEVQGLVQLSSLAMRDERHADFPERVDGIKIGTRCDRLHFLQACIWDVRDGTEVGHYVIHFADGEKLEVPIIFGVDLRDWQVWTVATIGGPADAAMAWTGTNIMAPIRLYRMAWDNPKDGVAVDRIDFVSAMTRAAPFLVGITAQQFSPVTPEFWLARARSLKHQGKTADALARLEQGTARLPGSMALWTALGAAQRDAGRSDEAYRTFSRAVLIAQTNEMVLPAERKQALLARCDFLRRQERFAEAATDYRAAHDLPLPSSLEDGALTNSPPDYHLATDVTVFLGATNLCVGLEHVVGGGGKTEPAQWDGKDCRTLTSLGVVRYALFLIDPTFKFTCGSNVIAEVEYFDSGRGSFGIDYDAVGRSYLAASLAMPLRDSQRWLTARFRLNNVRFENSQGEKADFRIWARGGPISVRRVTVIPEQPLRRTVAEAGANSGNLPLLEPIPPRDPQTPPHLIDLSRYYNGTLGRNWHGDLPDKNLAGLPVGVRRLAGFEFDVRGLIQVGSLKRYPFPQRVAGIPVEQVCRRLHFLHAALFASDLPDGTQIGRYVVHCADGRQYPIPLVIGRNLADWYDLREGPNRSLVVAWTGTNTARHTIRLFRTTWKNPAPEVRVQKIDFVSSVNVGDPGGAPFLIAITAETADTPEFWVSQAEELAEKGDLGEAITALDRAVQGLPTSPELWSAKGQLLEKVSQPNEALRAYTKAIDLAAADTNAFGKVLAKARLDRSALHQRLNRLDEAAADNLAAYGVPPRRSQARFEWVDLDLFYNGELGRRLGIPLEGETAKTFAAAVRGETGREFDLRGVVRLAGTNWVQQGRTPAPAAVTGIPVNRRFTRLQILHGTDVRERDGVQIGTYVLQYADGRKEEIGIVYGEDVRDKWCCSPGDDGTTRATVAWTGENAAVKKWRADGSIRFYLRNWNNPRPEVEVKSLDFVSAMTKCGPFLIAITAD